MPLHWHRSPGAPEHHCQLGCKLLVAGDVQTENLTAQWVTYPAVPVTSGEFFNVSVNAITWLSTGFLFAYCISAPYVCPI